MRGEITITDPRSDEVRSLIERHLAFAHSQVPAQDRHALDGDGLAERGVVFYALRLDGDVVAVGALKALDAGHVEVKSMHTAEAVRRQGLGRALLEHLVAVARERGFGRISLETGAAPAFAPARALYASAGFSICGPFGEYGPSPNKTFMTRTL